MVLPGWNVSEPIDLAYKLYEVLEALRSAPESAKAFVSKINAFSSNLSELQKILESETASHSAQDLEHLRATVLECQACVKRCVEYGEKFGKLTKDGRGKMDGAGQAARWTLQKEKVARLREEIDGQMNSIGLTLQIKTLCVGSSHYYLHIKTDERQCRRTDEARLPFRGAISQSPYSIRYPCQSTSIFLPTAQSARKDPGGIPRT